MPVKSSGSVKVFFPSRSREQLVLELTERLPLLAQTLPLVQAVLFGSWAKGRATAFSDIDLLVVYAGPPRDDAYRLVRRCLSLRGLEPHVYSEEEAAAVQPVLDRMTKDSIQLI